MLNYYIRQKPQLNGRHAVHREDCPFMPDIENRILLGSFNHPHEAVMEAKKYFMDSCKCSYCSKEFIILNYSHFEGMLSFS